MDRDIFAPSFFCPPAPQASFFPANGFLRTNSGDMKQRQTFMIECHSGMRKKNDDPLFRLQKAKCIGAEPLQTDRSLFSLTCISVSLSYFF
ncbi:hypothetical protein CEXT_656721 [Caerostris extrusa]|uniref:Uncharacterized protein n=1 Tax=Caerostris extrusa TaxID=172846 RepID=A0AAV4XCR8_CAEEX|nr:hypothetical protein CEXT_656721 [Caerostris extrusa]